MLCDSFLLACGGGNTDAKGPARHHVASLRASEYMGLLVAST